MLEDRGGNSAAYHPADGFELDELRHIQAAREPERPDPRRSTRREAKRRWLDQRDEMKFSHSIQFNAVPDWSSHYIAYSNLKKLSVRLIHACCWPC